ncbi:hypothetical protein M501DRAFT_1002455 [Patellaria atrata CBS 101060]|uniref:Hemerythrin-like domain-containing protein n=1 Tax=Patellaria atrata CBS 101060 TaxID=1346257 RepID=A0A9P4SCM3_9PEZI|nr:hypothetical protein M501DRAFT_1002455 [Patellaria atrata CBS 101060]
MDMLNAHNALLRGLNSIYLQAPHIPTSSTASFLTYTSAWLSWLTHHHHVEETYLFPAIERLSRSAFAGSEAEFDEANWRAARVGVMDELEKQHHAFVPGLGAMEAWVAACREGRERYDGVVLRGIIEEFAEVMRAHLVDEVVELDKLGGLDERGFRREYLVMEEAMREGDKSMIWPIVMRTSDKTFEGGNPFPPVPAPLRWLIHHYFERKYKGAWVFSPCDTWSRPRDLPFAPEGGI